MKNSHSQIRRLEVRFSETTIFHSKVLKLADKKDRRPAVFGITQKNQNLTTVLFLGMSTCG